LIIGAAFAYHLSSVPVKLEQIATKAPNHPAKLLVNIHIYVFVPGGENILS
jgi:hypothetical protein